MQLKDILVHIDNSPQSAARLALACDLARRHEAHLTGLVVADAVLPVAITGEPAGHAESRALAAMLGQLRVQAAEAAASAREAFDDLMRRNDLRGEWREVEGQPVEVVPLHARYADLTILGQPSPQGDSRLAGVIDAVLFTSGRPLLIVPYAGEFRTLGRSVLIGWDAGRESARALHDALPVIARAERATVLAVNPRHGIGGHGDVPAADIALHLARHGLRVTASHVVSHEVAPGDVLLNTAADLGADLLVIGGYGHSRLRERLMGGVTRTMLERMTLPVLMSH